MRGGDYDNGKSSSRNGAGLSSGSRSGRDERKRAKEPSKDVDRGGAGGRRDEKRRKRSRSKDYEKDK